MVNQPTINMKALLATIILVVVSIPVRSQCKYSVDKTDEFTGLPTVITEAKVNKDVIFKPTLTGGAVYLNLMHFNGSVLERDLVITLADSLSFKFASGSIVTLYPREEVREQVATLMGVTTRYMNVTYHMPPEALRSLATETATMVRVLMQGRHLDYKIPPAAAERLKKASECLSARIR